MIGALKTTVPVVSHPSLVSLRLKINRCLSSPSLFHCIGASPRHIATAAKVSSSPCPSISHLAQSRHSTSRQHSTAPDSIDQFISKDSFLLTANRSKTIVVRKAVSKLVKTKASTKSKIKDAKHSTVIETIKSKDKKPRKLAIKSPESEILSAQQIEKQPRLPWGRPIDTENPHVTTANSIFTTKQGKRFAPGAGSTLSLHKTRKPRIQPLMEHKQRTGHSRIEPATRVSSHVHVHEELSEPIKILCEAMEEAQVKRVRQLPPVFVADTYEHAEMMMQLFEEFYHTTRGSPGPVGFDTETTSNFLQSYHPSPSLIQIASQDVCLLFQIHRIINEGSKGQPSPFPPRLKRFLEDPEQLMAGVAAGNDAKELKQAYGVQCAGVINLETMAKEHKILAASLADLDAMFGRPGREVIKTKKMLGWNWDSPDLNPIWIWYAAKDAFAGVAIYENMLSNNLKEGYVPYEQQFPMTDSETAADICTFLDKSVGKSKKVTLASLESTVAKSYSRFHKLYQPQDRSTQAKKYIKMLLEDGRVVSHSTEPLSDLDKHTLVSLAGRSISSMLRTPDGVAILSKYFKGRQVDVSTLSATGITLPVEGEDEEMADMRLFLELASLWDQPRKLATFASVYAHEKAAAGTRKLYLDALEDQNEMTKVGDATKEPEKIDRSKLPKAPRDRDEAVQVVTPLLKKLKRRGLLQQDGHLWVLDPEVQKLCFEIVPPSSPVLNAKKFKRAITSGSSSSAASVGESTEAPDETSSEVSESKDVSEVTETLDSKETLEEGKDASFVVTEQESPDVQEKKPRLS
ncbi:hypothetical protein BGZ72_008515 [Mortierella alpina]|nr:hypothetical protein BGZ72_008515 [Mortierella alpina]